MVVLVRAAQQMELHEAGHRRGGEHLAMVDVVDATLVVDHAGADAARADVDDEDAHRPLRTTARARRDLRGPASPG